MRLSEVTKVRLILVLVLVILVSAVYAVGYLLQVDNDLPELIKTKPVASIQLISIQEVYTESVVIAGELCARKMTGNIYPSETSARVSVDCEGDGTQ